MTTPINGGDVFLRRQLSDLSISPREFEELRRLHLVRQVTRGVWVDASVPDAAECRFAAARLIKPEHAVFCNSTAAWLRGVDTFKPSERFLLKPQCVVPIGSTRCTSRLVKCREALIPDADVMEIDDVLLTVDVRTTSDMLREQWRPYALAAADGMAHAGLVEPEEVQDYVAKLKGYRWIIQGRELAFLIEPLTDSPGESWSRLRIIDAGFPRPEPQVPVADANGEVRGWLDLALKEWKVGAEYDGREFHTEDADTSHDARRRRYFRDVHGWRIVVGRREDIFGTNMAFEQQIGEWIGREPLPRSW
ncbi:hypothetical protein MU582_10030 [Nocardioidaceae bacterium SCSIO 66511]|nr:hypothetical protein MU582_10030 [Nocardioidaceae bacterium SCSIO 66511]